MLTTLAVLRYVPVLCGYFCLCMNEEHWRVLATLVMFRFVPIMSQESEKHGDILVLFTHFTHVKRVSIIAGI